MAITSTHTWLWVVAVLYCLGSLYPYSSLPAAAEPDKAKSKCLVYAASPYGFAKSTDNFRKQHFNKTIEEAGCKVIDPWDLPFPKHKSPSELGTLLGAMNTDALKKADGVVAALDGTDVDSGTAAEIGYAAGLKKWVIGYRGDTRQTGEGLGTVVNLQVEYFINQSGGQVVCSLSALKEAIACKTGICKENLTLKSCNIQRELESKLSK